MPVAPQHLLQCTIARVREDVNLFRSSKSFFAPLKNSLRGAIELREIRKLHAVLGWCVLPCRPVPVKADLRSISF